MIQKIIHHVWPGEDEFLYEEWRQSWIYHHSNWQFKFWRINNLPFEKMHINLVNVIKNPNIHYVIKSDIIRWEVIRIFGGIYIDTDMECMKSFDRFLYHNCFCGTFRTKFCNAFIASEKENIIINNACEYLNTVDYDKIKTKKEVIDICGSVGMTPFLKRFDGIYPAIFYDKHINGDPKRNDERYCVHHWTNNRSDGWVKTFGLTK